MAAVVGRASAVRRGEKVLGSELRGAVYVQSPFRRPWQVVATVVAVFAALRWGDSLAGSGASGWARYLVGAAVVVVVMLALVLLGDLARRVLPFSPRQIEGLLLVTDRELRLVPVGAVGVRRPSRRRPPLVVPLVDVVAASMATERLTARLELDLADGTGLVGDAFRTGRDAVNLDVLRLVCERARDARRAAAVEPA